MEQTCYDSIHMTEPVETAELLAFARTVDARSLSRAAFELGVPRATVSRRLARLEQRLGTRLLRRTTRSMALTDAGETLYRHAQIVLDAVEHAEQSVRQADDVVRGDLRVSVPPGMRDSFVRLVCEFAKRYPDVNVQIHASSRRVDLQRDGYDVAVRAGVDFEPGLIARKLATDHVLAVASPAYLAAHGTPKNVRELAKHRCLMGFERGEVPATSWPAGKDRRIHIKGAMSTNSMELLVGAAVAGLGIACLPVTMAREHLETGRLVPVLQGNLGAETQVAIVYPERELMPPQVRAFVEEVVKWAPSQLDWKLPASCTKHGKKKP